MFAGLFHQFVWLFVSLSVLSVWLFVYLSLSLGFRSGVCGPMPMAP